MFLNNILSWKSCCIARVIIRRELKERISYFSVMSVVRLSNCHLTDMDMRNIYIAPKTSLRETSLKDKEKLLRGSVTGVHPHPHPLIS